MSSDGEFTLIPSDPEVEKLVAQVWAALMVEGRRQQYVREVDYQLQRAVQRSQRRRSSSPPP